MRSDQIATKINDRVDNPAEAGVESYVGLEHLDPDSLRIRRWGEPTDVESTKLRFQPGDIIFCKRRVYQRKFAVADFEGICSALAMVLRAKPGAVLAEFLPFFMQSDLFMERAFCISVGSLSPTINWKALAAEEVLLPPIQEQARLVDILKGTEATTEEAATADLDRHNVDSESSRSRACRIDQFPCADDQRTDPGADRQRNPSSNHREDGRGSSLLSAVFRNASGDHSCLPGAAPVRARIPQQCFRLG